MHYLFSNPSHARDPLSQHHPTSYACHAPPIRSCSTIDTAFSRPRLRPRRRQYHRYHHVPQPIFSSSTHRRSAARGLVRDAQRTQDPLPDPYPSAPFYIRRTGVGSGPAGTGPEGHPAADLQGPSGFPSFIWTCTASYYQSKCCRKGEGGEVVSVWWFCYPTYAFCTPATRSANVTAGTRACPGRSRSPKPS